MARRVLLGALGVVIISAAATAVLALNEVDKVVEALGQNKAVSISPKVLAATSRGGPETLLLVGDDRRPPPKRNPGGFVLPHSNEMLLVRIDPSKPTISMLSIPRELRVTIRPPGGRPLVNRINAAYTIGGIQLMTETIKRVLGVSINHVFVVTFPKFRRAVDEMGCVYLTVDRRYYHVNEPGGEQYFEINLQPGYQRVCGRQALEFVANRHEDTSLQRDARDQRFLLEAKAQYGASLFANREKFERILGRAVETDLHGSGQVLDLLALLVQAQGKPVRQAHFQVNLQPTYDTATPAQIHESVQSFLSGTAPISGHALGAAVRSRQRQHRRHSSGPSLSLSPTPASALVAARSAAPELPFALEYPRVRQSYGAALPDTLRRYDIRDPQGRLYPSYAIVVNSGPLGAFYDVQGTTWADPPLLHNPSETVRIGPRTYALFYAGEQIRTVAWREGNATYWVSNTLTDSVQPREMLAIAERTQPLVGSAASLAGGRAAIPSASSVALPAPPGHGTSVAEKVGALFGLASIVTLALLTLRLVLRQRELRSLRAQVAQAMALEARLRPVLASAGAIAPADVETAPSGGAAQGGGAAAGEGPPSGHRAAAPAPPAGTTAGVGTGAAGTTAAPRAAPARAGAYARTVYRSPRRLRRGRVLAGASLPAALALGLVLALALAGGGSSGPGSERAVPVAVFNATGTPGAAHSVAATLRSNHVRVGRIGDIKRSASLGPGAYVLYPPGTERQARRLARLIYRLSPTVAPMQVQVQSAVGRAHEIVVVLDG